MSGAKTSTSLTTSRSPFVVFAILACVTVGVAAFTLPTLERFIWHSLYHYSLEDNQTQAERIARILSIELAKGREADAMLSDFQQMLETTMQSKERFTCIVEGNHRVIAHPNPTNVGKDVTGWTMESPAGVVDFSYGPRNGVPYGGTQTRLDGSQDISFQAPIAGVPWSVCVHTRLGVIDEQTQKILGSFARATIPALLALMLISALWVHRLNLRHDRAIVEKARLIEQAKDEAERATASRGQFIANISHELRTPLNSLLLLSKNLVHNRAGNLTAKQLQSIEVIDRSGRQLHKIIEDVLDLSKVDAGKLAINPAAVHISSLADHLRTLLEPAAVEKGIALTFKVSEGLPEAVETDGLRVEQILRNLISNAIKFTSSGGVDVKFGHESSGPQPAGSAEAGPPSYLAISVRDTGIGIAEDKQRDIFEYFEQASQDTAQQYGGTGLGLAISLQLARLLGGHIRCESTPGSGSTFTLLLPLVAGTAVHAPPVARTCQLSPAERDLSLGTPEGRGMRVLLVDDDARALFSLAGELDKAGLEVELATNGAEAIKKLESDGPFDCVFLDLNMPVMDGWATIAKIRGELGLKQLPIIVLSASSEPELAERCLGAGAVGFVAKPAGRAEVFEQLTLHLGAAKSEEAPS